MQTVRVMKKCLRVHRRKPKADMDNSLEVNINRDYFTHG
jgi:hypothetical protein